MVAKAAAAPASAHDEQAKTNSPPTIVDKPRTGLTQSAGDLPIASVPPAVSDAERALLQNLRARRLELDAREHSLAEREGVLEAAQQRLNARVSQLAELQARLEQLDAQRRQHDEANWSGLVRIYETMKARDAAAIFNDMDMPVLLEVVDRMKEAKAAPILAAMQPDRARLVTSQLAAQRTKALELQSTPSTSG